MQFDPSTIIINPRITEKASLTAESNTYVFNVVPKSNKMAIANAIKAIYNVVPVSVNVSSLPAKSRFSRGKWVRTGAVRKAYVTLKKGDKIEIA
jgi:large subunit ribosomal protein L23